jgi:hypothetical protein
VVDAVADEGNGPWARLQAGLAAYLEQSIDNAEHRALLQVAPGALGTERCRQIDGAMGLPILRAALQELVDAGEVPPQPIELAARVLFAALCEAALAAGADPRPQHARRDAAAVLNALVSGLRTAG